MTLVEKRNYGDYSSDNYGSHTQQIDIGGLRLWFSYDTVVAFSDGHGRRVCKNVWGTTTGKHLNWIDGGDKKGRIPSDQFDAELKAVLEKHNLIVS